jgi:hypothetical protein
VQEGKTKLELVAEEKLPGVLRAKKPEERQAWIMETLAKRAELKEKVLKLEAKRKEWMDKEVGKLKLLGSSFDSSVVKVIKQQALKYGLKW